jgi:hypothetical protein
MSNKVVRCTYSIIIIWNMLYIIRHKSSSKLVHNIVDIINMNLQQISSMVNAY